MTNIGSQTIDTFLSSLSAKQPTPGGGAVAGILSAISTSLGNMVVAYSLGKDTLKEHTAIHEDCIRFLDAAQIEAMKLSDADAIAYEALHAMWKLPKDHPTRVADWDRVVQKAIDVPIQTMELSNRILITLELLVGKTNPMLASDLAIAAILADAAARAANLNVQINLSQLRNDSYRDDVTKKANDLLGACKEVADSIETSCQL